MMNCESEESVFDSILDILLTLCVRLAQLREDLFTTASEGELGGWCGWVELISVTEVITCWASS